MLDLGSVTCTRPQTVRVLTPAGPQSQAGAEGAHPGRRGLRAPAPQGEPPGRQGGRLAVLGVGGNVRVLRSFGTRSPRRGDLRDLGSRRGLFDHPRPTGLPLPALGAARAAEPGGEGRSSVSPPGRQSSVAEKTRTRSQRRRSSQPRPVLSSRESQAPWNFSQPPLPYLRGGGAVA